MWLEVANSNNNPSYIAHYYLDCVQQLGGITHAKIDLIVLCPI